MTTLSEQVLEPADILTRSDRVYSLEEVAKAANVHIEVIKAKVACGIIRVIHLPVTSDVRLTIEAVIRHFGPEVASILVRS